jgi:hypothetical protein
MPDVVLEVGLGHATKSEPFIEALQIHLRRNSDFSAPSLVFDQPESFGHENMTKSGSPDIRMGNNATDRGLRIFDARWDEPRVSDEPLPPFSLLPAEKMVSLLVHTVSVQIHAMLLHDKHYLPQCHPGIEIGR